MPTPRVVTARFDSTDANAAREPSATGDPFESFPVTFQVTFSPGAYEEASNDSTNVPVFFVVLVTNVTVRVPSVTVHVTVPETSPPVTVTTFPSIAADAIAPVASELVTLVIPDDARIFPAASRPLTVTVAVSPEPTKFFESFVVEPVARASDAYAPVMIRSTVPRTTPLDETVTVAGPEVPSEYTLKPLR